MLYYNNNYHLFCIINVINIPVYIHLLYLKNMNFYNKSIN